MSASETGRRANASNAKRTANIMPIKVIARWANQGTFREGMSAAGSPCCASAGAQTTNSEMPERRARTISETPARRGRWTRLGALWSCDPAHMLEPARTRVSEGTHMAVRLRARGAADRAVTGQTAAAIIHPAICATRRLSSYRRSFNCGKVARDADIKYAGRVLRGE